MKKIFYSVFLQLIIVISVFANSYNTIDIDGNNTGWATDEQFTNCSSADNAYFTWDAEYIYMGISDADADENIATFVYFDTDPLGANGTTSAWAWGGSSNYINTPFNADWTIVWGKDESGNFFIEVMQYNNVTSIWDIYSTSSSTSLVISTVTLVEFAIGADYREVRIKRSMLGNPDEFKTSMFSEQQWASYYRYFAWPSNNWSDANRTTDQSIPHYYGFFPESGISPDRSAYYDASFEQWTGAARSTSWATGGNWSDGVPTSSTLVRLPATATVIVDAAGAECDDILMKTGATLTVNTDGTLTSNGGIYNYTGNSGVVVQSSSSGNGSLIEYRYGNTLMTVQCYTTAGQWHSFAAPVSGLTANDLYIGDSPGVWIAEFNESTLDYTYITELTEPLDDVKGWLLWVEETVSDHTYSFQGLARESMQGEDNNASRSAVGTEYGYAYVGNQFTSAIDWDATSPAWYNSNLNNAIYVITIDGWASYVGGAGNNGGSRYIAMNQGFFVQVTDNNAPPEYGTLKMSRDVCVHNDVGFLKSNTTIDSLIRLQVNQSGKSDETVVRFLNDATEEFDGQYDASKFFSYSENNPLVFSKSMMDSYSINSLPKSVQEVSIDVAGINGVSMTISATEINSFDSVYLKDKLTATITNLALEDYTFTYNNNFNNRFTLFFSYTGDQENLYPELSFDAFSSNNEILIQINHTGISEISVVNMLGQQVFSQQTSQSKLSIPIHQSGYYLVKVHSGQHMATKKVFVK